MIVTCRKHVPFSWLFSTATTGALFMYMYCAMGGAFLFSLKKFLDNPAGLTFIMSVPTLLHMVFAPYVNFMSDRIWTRYGRRKPFALAGWILAMVAMAVMPLMPNFWLLIAAYLAYQVALDLRGPMDPLNNEIVPPWQRGRFSAIGQWMGNLGNMGFAFLALGRFDDQQFYLGIPLNGETAIYWTGASALLILVLFIALGIKETDPKSSVRGEKFSMRSFFTSILNKNLFPVYFLIFGSAMMNAGLGTMGALLYTDQWQFTKQEMGNNNMVGGVINMFLIVILGIFADRMNRLKSYQVLMTLTVLVNFFFYLYVNFFLYDRRPILLELIMFGETLSILGILIGMTYQPMVYDYVPRNEMGTYMAGSSLLNRITGLVTLNGAGLFIWAYASIFLPPGGDMTRIVFQHSQTNAQVQEMLARADWVDPVSGQPKPLASLSHRPWYGSGAYLDFGTAYEIRMGNSDSIALKGRRDAAESERVKLANKENNLRARIRLLADKNPSSPEFADLTRQADGANASMQPYLDVITQADAELAKRGKNLHDQVVGRLGDKLLVEGEQIQGAQWLTARILTFPARHKVDAGRLERILLDLRREFSGVIDLRPTQIDKAFGVALSIKGTTDVAGQDAILDRFRRLVTKYLSGDMDAPREPLSTQTAPLLELDLKVIEEPMDTHLSPISKLVNWGAGFFTLPPGADRKIMSMGRALRKIGETEHVAVENIEPATRDDFALRVFAIVSPALLEKPLPAAEDPIARRLKSFLPDAGQSSVARHIFDRIALIGRDVRMNIPTRELQSGFAPPTYDYMAGYLWMLGLGVIGLAITFVFAHRERRGLIQKRGLEEASAHSKKGNEKHLAPEEEEYERDPQTGEIVTYTPGYVPQKILFLAVSLLIFSVGAVRLIPDLVLLSTGKFAQAEVSRIVKSREGLPDEQITQDEQWKSVELMRDRSSTYWNVFSFALDDGSPVAFRSAFGSQFRPLNPLLDADGLPATQWVVYDPKNPKKIAQPLELSNWFIPLTMSLLGGMGTVIAGLLLYHARRPMPVPYVPGLAASGGPLPESPSAA
ncbi:MAG: MFS transporter [Verrucomicrobiae bacterium]